MSFFSDVLDSIGSDKAPAPPPKPVKRPTSIDSTDLSKPVAKLGIHGTSTPPNSTKRKAEELSVHPSEKALKANPTPGPPSSVKTEQLGQSKPSSAQPTPTVKPATSAPAVAAKVPAKGSFADIMARAKAAQEQKGQVHVGMIKHQAVSKEKGSKSLDRKREEEEKTKAMRSKLGPRPGASGRVEKRRSVSPAKGPEKTGLAKQARPPMHAPASSYKGTMKPASDRSKKPSSGSSHQIQKKHGRYDEYLGTDEEEDNDIVEDDDEDDGDSDASSDMEAGAFDIDEEENRALKAAKDDDARELELEKQLKREKEERRRRLQVMADKKR